MNYPKNKNEYIKELAREIFLANSFIFLGDFGGNQTKIHPFLTSLFLLNSYRIAYFKVNQHYPLFPLANSRILTS